MLAGLFKLIDWTAMQMAAASMPQPDGRNPRVLEARQLIDWPNFFPPEVPAAAVEFTGKVRFHFESPCPCVFEENNTVYGKLYRCDEKWQERPTVLLLHGWNDIIDHRFRFPSLARQFNRNGLNAATLEAPYHFQRRPRQLGAWSNFLCPDILRTVEAVRQAVMEIRAFSQWLRQQGCPAVGLVGVSLGGWLAGLAACHDPRFACAVLLVPAPSMDRLMEDAPFFRGIRVALNGQKIQAGRLNLIEARPVLPKENILLIEAVHDLFVPDEITEHLWRSWDQPEIWRLQQGHISTLYVPGLHGRIIQWMKPRLLPPGAKETGSP